MRVVGYVREAPDPRDGDPAFAQTERIRRWAAEGGHQLVAICLDSRGSEAGARRDGLRALMGILAENAARAVVVADLNALSADKIVQEIIIHDLRVRGASVVSTSEDDLEALDHPTGDRLRTLVRDVLTRLDEHRTRFAGAGSEEESDEGYGGDVLVELITSGLDEPPEIERIRPVR